MTERTIFLGALEREDPGERAAYLDCACAGQPALRRQVEELLRSHREAGTFLDVPAPEQLAAAEQSLAFLGPPREPGALGRLDHYDVLEVVGRGGTGVVLKARDTKLQRVVAIKALAPRLAASAGARERFVREAQAAAAVRDDHVVAIHAVSEDGPVPYLVMEYISGTTLESTVRRGAAPGLKEILRLGMQIAKGLAAAHAQGLVHRDIKPANILLENGVQRVKITDFGLAGAASDADRGGIAGTPLYMSPEQARGEPTDPRSDLFSLGSVLYTLCAGRPPFQADTTAAALKRVGEGTPPPLREVKPDVPAWPCEVIARLQARDARDRFASAQEVADLLSKRLAALQQPPAPTGKAVRGPSSRRRRALLVAGLVALLAAIAALAALWKPWQRPTPEPRPDRTPSRSGSGPPASLDLRRETIPPALLALAGGGDPAQAPPELAAVLGDGRFLLPRAGQTAWPDQSADGKLLAVPLDEEVVLFDAQAGTCAKRLQGPGGRVFYTTFSRDGRLLAAATRDEAGGLALRVWDLSTGRVLYTHPQPGPTVSCAAAFTPDGEHLICERAGKLDVREARSGRLVQTLDIHPNGVASLCFRPDGRHLAVATWYGNHVKILGWEGQKLVEIRALPRHPLPVVAAVYSPDGRFLASSDLSGFKLWDARTLQELRAIPWPGQQLAFSPDGQTLFAATTTEAHRTAHTFARWEVGTWKELPALSVGVAVEPVRAFHRLSRDGKILFVTPQHSATYVKAFDTATGLELFPRRGHVARLHAVAVSPDGRTVASAGEDWAVKVWDLPTGRVLHSLTAHTGAVHGLAFSPDGNRLASGSRDGTIVLWDVARGTELRTLRGPARSPSRLRFSPDGRTLAAGGEGGVVKLWEVATGNEVTSLKGHTGTVRCVAFSPDGNYLASGGEDKTVRLHPLGKGDSRKFTLPQGVSDLAFAPDGRTLAAAGDGPEGVVRVWDLEAEVKATWRGHTGPVWGVAFSPAAPLLASCAEDGTVRLWDRTGGVVLRTLGPGPFGGPVRAVAFTPDGRYLVTANANGTVYALRVDAPARKARP